MSSENTSEEHGSSQRRAESAAASRTEWVARSPYEFAGLRAQLFREALAEYPNARRDDYYLMRKYLDPQPGDRVLGFGEGSGYFCGTIAKAVGPTGRYLITDPSPELVCSLPESVERLPQVQVTISPVEQLDIDAESFDKAWACGAFHHCPNQTEAFKRVYQVLRPGGRLVLFDVFQGTPLARHFDDCVARYCVTGHEVKFMSEEFARALCFLAGFPDANVEIVDVPHRLCFATEWDMGKFVYKMHAMTLFPGTLEERIQATVNGVKRHLTVERDGDGYVLHFDQKGIIARKPQ
ncbi:MAG TPA: methyltransferase domain-containing protein [Polyangiaceae bacterium]